MPTPWETGASLEQRQGYSDLDFDGEVLRNLAGARVNAEPEQIEASLSEARAAQLHSLGIRIPSTFTGNALGGTGIQAGHVACHLVSCQ